MNLRRKVLIIAAAALMVLGFGLVVVYRYGPEPKLMYCGHSKHVDGRSLWATLIGARVNRLCKSRDMVMRLQILANSDLSEVENMLGEPSFSYRNHDYLRGLKCSLQTNGGGWTVTVPQQNGLAGHYLLTSAGRLHFNRTQPATTNDFVLHDWSR